MSDSGDVDASDAASNAASDSASDDAVQQLSDSQTAYCRAIRSQPPWTHVRVVVCSERGSEGGAERLPGSWSHCSLGAAADLPNGAVARPLSAPPLGMAQACS